jgi:polyphosphate kinase
MAKVSEKVSNVIDQSDYLSRDLSWLKFDERVLDQARSPHRTLMERLKFLAITASNLDEFFMIRVGSLYNYLDYHKQRVDYSGLREIPFKKALFTATQKFSVAQQAVFTEDLLPLFAKNELRIVQLTDLTGNEQSFANDYFDRTVYPTLTPMLYDYTHIFPVLLAKVLIFGVVTQNTDAANGRKIRVPGLPISFDGERLGVRRDVPAIGADGREILAELGYEAADIERLVAAGILGASPAVS